MIPRLAVSCLLVCLIEPGQTQIARADKQSDPAQQLARFQEQCRLAEEPLHAEGAFNWCLDGDGGLLYQCKSDGHMYVELAPADPAVKLKSLRSGTAECKFTAGPSVVKGVPAGTSPISRSQANDSEDMSACVVWDRKSNQLADFITNRCKVKIFVTWQDSGDCSRVRCSEDVPAAERHSVTKSKGHISYGACLYPKAPAYEGDSDKFFCR